MNFNILIKRGLATCDVLADINQADEETLAEEGRRFAARVARGGEWKHSIEVGGVYPWNQVFVIIGVDGIMANLISLY